MASHLTYDFMGGACASASSHPPRGALRLGCRLPPLFLPSLSSLFSLIFLSIFDPAGGFPVTVTNF